MSDFFGAEPPSFDFDTVERLTVGAQGEPGQRLFFLQVRSSAALVTVKLEKQQVAALTEYLFQLLADLPDCGPLPDQIDPELPVEPLFAVSSIGVSYDEDRDRILLLLEEIGTLDDDEDDDDDPLAGFVDAGEAGARMRVSVTREQATAFAARGSELVEAGRPPCPLCGHPLDPRGHVCPRTNGNTPPRL